MILARDRQRRNVRAPQQFGHEDLVAYAFTMAEDIEIQEPFTYREANSSPESKQWSLAMNEDMESLYKNNTFKACLVAKLFTQREGVDFSEVFSPVVKHSSIRVLLAMVALHDMELKQLDVKMEFLHGELEEKIYMRQPEGFDIFMSSKGYSRSNYDSCVYHKKFPDGSYVYLLLYADDVLIASKNMSKINQLKAQLKSEFEMKDLGAAEKIL
ncbi:retrovirus-related pol polyprotein from transposon TNT 1-94 [Tanacetum coccineum]